jgi:predicted nucleic acid-binding protein
MMVFVDSNVPMYVAGREHPLRDPARRFLERARSGDVDICTSTEVLQEILYRYASLKRLDLAASVYELFVQLCPTVFPVALADTDRAKALVASARGASVRDAVHAAVMLNHDVSDIATFDEGFDRVDGIKRIQLR